MSFSERTRQWWLDKVGKGVCQYEVYTEEKGFKKCGKPAKHVHHIGGRRIMIEEGQDPEGGVGLPLCKEHNVRGEGGVLGDEDASFYPDIAQAYVNYGKWKDDGGQGESPFETALKEHQELAQAGIIYSAADEMLNGYYEDLMVEASVRYTAVTGEKKPRVKRRK